MQFIRDGVFYKVVRITGPTHNMLSLRFAAADDQASQTVRLLNPQMNASLDSMIVVSEAQAGVKEANQQFGTSYRIASLEFANDDTPPESVYRLLAFSLIERIAKGRTFVDIPAKQ